KLLGEGFVTSLLLSPSAKDDGGAPPISARAVFARFWPLTKGDRRWLFCSGLLLAVEIVCEVAAIFMFAAITDDALTAGSLSAFWSPALIWLGLTAVAGLAAFGGEYLMAWVGERFLLRLRGKVFAHVQRLSPEFFERRRLGDLVSRFSGDVDDVEQLVASGLVQLAATFLRIAVFAGVAVYLRWELALAVFILAPIFWLAARSFTRRVKQAARQERRSNGAISTIVEESLANATVVQAYRQEDAQEQRLHAEGVRWQRAKLAEARLSSVYEPLVQVIETVCILAILGLGTWELANHRITLGGLLAFSAILGLLYSPIQQLGEIALVVSSATASAERLVELLDATPTVTDASHAQTLARSRGKLEVRDVTFRYPTRDSDSLNQLSFIARPGEVVVITGASGAGKSTIAKLLLRFYDPTQGQIFLDDADITGLSLETVRGSVTLLPQETLIFHGTIRDNIAYGRPDATEAEIITAARDAGAHEFIVAMPQGYGAVVGQRGRRLSGGQRQRIAIARALLRDTPVLILDEPTTGLDTPAADRIMQPLRRLMAGRTTILITHDLRLAANADTILVLEEGEPVLPGAQPQLLADNEPYAQLLAAPAA
ncbi:MAG: ABC transporter ATP-binding protein, partial [Mycobacteriales bacterium]